MSTIAAISTAPGKGGIAVVRVSGLQAIEFTQRIFRPSNGIKSLSTMPTATCCYGYVVDCNENIVDTAIVTVFRSPNSFTGEDIAEISCHGSIYIQQTILQLLIESGCQLAQPGEFTQRAFLNGKMDLSQAEAVADLIASTSASAHRMALHQMRGGFSDKLKLLRAQLLDFVSLIELELDFSEEDVQFADRTQLSALASDIEGLIRQLSDSFKVGQALKNGIPVALVGETNVGKSTLLNLLLEEEKAIVSDVHGTTRDYIEDVVEIKGVTFRFIDTAGIRKTLDTVEKLGIERTFQKIEQASIVLWILDCTQLSEHMEWLTEKIQKRAEGKQVMLVFNKIDKITSEETEVLNQLFSQFEAEKLFISAKQKLNLHLLEEALLRASQIPEIEPDHVVVSNVRHYEALRKALCSIERVSAGLSTGITGDFISQDIRECMHYLGEITGQITNHDVLGNIFSKFCIGK